jgi:predicted hydrolase (HD superfamily)
MISGMAAPLTRARAEALLFEFTQSDALRKIVEAICSHADYMGIPRDTPLKKAIYACDELVGFIGACVKVRPSKKVADLPVESVVKKLKDKAFARSVDRSYVYGGAAAVGRPLEEHVRFLIDTLRPIAEEIGL